jgi:hypothetical protein
MRRVGLLLFCLPVAAGLLQASAIFSLIISDSPPAANQTSEIDVQDVSGPTACMPSNFPQPDTVCSNIFIRSGTLHVTFADATTGTATLGGSLPVNGDLNPVPEFTFPISPEIVALTFDGTFSTDAVLQNTTLTLFDGSTFAASPDFSASLDFATNPDCSPGNCFVTVSANAATTTVPDPNSLSLVLCGLLLLVIPIFRKARQLDQ